MSRRSLSLAAGLGAALMLAGALAGCATPVTGSSASPSATPTAEMQTVSVDAAWLDGGAAVAVLLEGSSTCVPMADDVTYADGVLSVSLLEPVDDTACTRDLVLRGIPVTVPVGVDPAQSLTVAVRGEGYEGEAELAGVSGMTPGTGMDDGTPSAGWATADSFALLTYGSSTCLPQVTDAAVSATGEIAVTFATPPADQVCTADFAPRITVVSVPGVEPGAAYEAVLAGDSFDGTRLAIAGAPA